MAYGIVKLYIDEKLVQVRRNLLTEIYRQAHTDWLTGVTPVLPNYIGVGLGITEPSSADLALENEFSRAACTWRWAVVPTVARFQARWNVDDPPAIVTSPAPLREIGLFDAGPITILNDSFEDWTGGVADSWTLAGAGASQAQSVDAYHKSYAVAVTAGAGAIATYYQQIAGYAGYAGKAISLWAAVKHNVANKARLYIDDGVVISYSSYHTGLPAPDGSYQVLKKAHTVAAIPTKLEIGMQVAAAGGAPKLDWMNLIENGNPWAKALITIDKYNTQVLNVIWEIYTVPEEEGEMAKNTFAKEELTVTTGVVSSLTSAVYASPGEATALEALLSVEDASIRVWAHGGDPSSSSGHLVFPDGQITLGSYQDIVNFRAIALTSSAKLKVSYSR